jgi:hypothetical protein
MEYLEKKDISKVLSRIPESSNEYSRSSPSNVKLISTEKESFFFRMSDELLRLIKFDLTDYDIEEFKRFESFLEFRLIMQ